MGFNRLTILFVERRRLGATRTNDNWSSAAAAAADDRRKEEEGRDGWREGWRNRGTVGRKDEGNEERRDGIKEEEVSPPCRRQSRSAWSLKERRLRRSSN